MAWNLNLNTKRNNYEIILYDIECVVDLICTIRKCFKSSFRYAYIVHQPETEGKKVHIHLYILFNNRVLCSTLVNKLVNLPFGIVEQNINFIDNLTGAIRYLIHFDNKDKIQYSFEDIISDIDVDTLNSCFSNDVLQDLSLKSLLSYVDITHCSLIQFIKYCVDNHYEDVLKKYYSIIKDYINML